VSRVRSAAAAIARGIGGAIEKLAIREFWMFTIAAIALGVVGAIGFQVAVYGVPERADAIIGGIVTGGLLLCRDVINAIKALWGAVRAADDERL
jgi:hypothetical protein